MAANNNIDEELLDACNNEDLTKVQLLLSLGADPCHVISGKDCAPIHYAVNCYDDSTEILKAIISSGRATDLDVRTSSGMKHTPLIVACSSGNLECARMLVKNGAGTSGRNRDGDSVLHRAALSANLDMVKECLKWNGVNVNQLNACNQTALIYVCKYTAWANDDLPDAVRLLLSAGADVNLIDDEGHPAAWYAEDNEEITAVFMNHMKTKMEKTNLPTALGASTSSIVNDNIANVTTTIKEVFPRFDDQMITSIIATMESAGIDYEYFDPQHLLLLKESDFGDTLKPVFIRLLLQAFEKEYSGKL